MLPTPDADAEPVELDEVPPPVSTPPLTVSRMSGDGEPFTRTSGDAHPRLLRPLPATVVVKVSLAAAAATTLAVAAEAA